MKWVCLAIYLGFIFACPFTTARADDSGPQSLAPTAPMPATPGDHKLKFKTKIGDQSVDMSYLLHLPPNYSETGKPCPMLVFFHGIGEVGTDLAGVYALGPMTMLKEDGGNPTFAASCPFIVLCPQCPPRGQKWDTDYMYKATAQLVAMVVKRTRCDADRVYATGLSMGGLGTWCVAEEAPDLFAAIAPLSAMRWQPETAGDKLKFVSVWAVAGLHDEPRFVEGTQAMEKSLAGGLVTRRYTYFINRGHDAWWPPYQNPQFYEWFLSQHRPSSTQKKKLESQKSPSTTQPMPTTPGHHLLSFDVKVGDQPFHMEYCLYIPKGYKPNSAPRPAMLFLHEQDTIGPVYHDICMHGPDLELEKKTALQNNFPFVVISPRLPMDCAWDTPGMTPAILSLVDHVSGSIALDPNRIYATGIDAGASGAWKLVADAPERFAALVPVLTDGSFNPPDDKGAAIKAVPGRVFVKKTDTAMLERLTQLTSGTPLDWKITKSAETISALGELPGYSDHQFLDWLQQQHKGPATVTSTK